jgi:hypothetical protein
VPAVRASGWLDGMWRARKNCPFLRIMMLDGWRSPMPRMNVATQYPALERMNISTALSHSSSVLLYLQSHIGAHSLSKHPALQLAAHDALLEPGVVMLLAEDCAVRFIVRAGSNDVSACCGPRHNFHEPFLVTG